MIRSVLLRLMLLTLGLAAAEIGLGAALAQASPGGWALVLVAGIPLVVAGSAGFMAPILGGRSAKGASHDA